MSTLSRRHFLRNAAAAAAMLPAASPVTGARAAAGGDMPITGDRHAELTPFDELMTGFLREHEVPGGSLAVARRGRLVYARGFGFADAARQVAVRPHALFRIASIAKPITAVAVLQLAEQGKIDPDAPILKHLPPEMSSIGLNGVTADERLGKVTVRHCLQHRGGWDRDKSGDPIEIPEKIAETLKMPLPVSAASVARYTLGKTLDFEPGSDYAYSNVGYLLLGRAVEKASGMGYETYVRKRVLEPLGITRMSLARALPKDRPADEVSYVDRENRTAPCVYPPQIGQLVPLADGGFNVEAFEAHGGWVGNAADLVRFASAFDDPATCLLLSAASIKTMFARPEGKAGHENDGTPKAAYYGCGWQVRPVGDAGKANHWHTGLLVPGTATLLVRRSDGLNWAVLFNTDASVKGSYLAGLIDPLVHQAADAVKDWPAGSEWGEVAP